MAFSGPRPFFKGVSLEEYLGLTSSINSSTGANLALSAPPTPILELNGAGPISIDTMVASIDGGIYYLLNSTGSPVTINHQTGAPAFEQFNTLTGASVAIPIGCVAALIYVGGYWQVLNIGAAGGGTDELVKVSAADTTPGYLSDKIVDTNGRIEVTIVNPGSNETFMFDIGADVALLASPSFTGTPTAPTAAALDNSTQIATTAFVKAAVDAVPASQALAALNIDWSLSETFYKAITVASTFTFSNIVDGKTITVALTNSTGLAYSVTFPTTQQELGTLETSVYANSTSIFVFTRINGVTYCTSYAGVV